MPSRCSAPPSAQKSFCTSAPQRASGGLTFCSKRAASRVSSRLPNHSLNIELLHDTLRHSELKVSAQARDVELLYKLRTACLKRSATSGLALSQLSRA